MPGPLQHSPARIVAELLIGAGYGTDPERTINGVWPIYISRQPDRPDQVIKISNTQGRDFGFTNPDSEMQEHQGIQVMVRSVNDEEGYYKAQQIAIFFDRVNRDIVGIAEVEAEGTGTVDYILTGLTRTSQVYSLGSETPSSKRQLFTINAVCAIRQCC